MTNSAISVGLQIGTQPPMSGARALLLAARVARLESVMLIDHFQSGVPRAIWNKDLTWLAAQDQSPHEFYDYQVLLGYLASRAGRVRLGVGVTEAIRRHPVLIAQAMLTLSHLTRRAPILGIGAGERMNVDPYGLDFSEPVTRLEEALQVIRLCLSARGPITFSGKHFRLDRATMDLEAPPGRVPQIWVGGHGPRMLRLTGRYGDGWYPVSVVSPQEYAAKLAAVRAAAAEAGRDAESITPALHRFAVIGATEREARAMLDTRAVRMLGLVAPADVWRQAGAVHPLGAHFDTFVDFVPDRHGRRAVEHAIAAVPDAVMTEGPLLWGTPRQVLAKLRAFGDAGMRHVVLAPVSGLVSRRAARYGLWATMRVARSLTSRRGDPAPGG
ncbi:MULTISPECIES: LLM class flavin-dependent oxidoreductase [Mycobacterium]|uniref:Phthiodiolone/phenolphthiodiolone dimycocerosates ketoreductase n=1 Tax=Mycobacterium persicum TaxID=1487726 RepID=A0AB38UQN2_9MYCO|nr:MULTISPECIES: LLM class flavin-dependent oxidoreductase [Mycobacterium]ARG55429.1 methylene-tetrahydromethanopterin reductase [Mycobacterium kansasii]KZS85479.1 methylene-tetrahydromethanopterin reductase [Mycobacterium persicum]ORB91584.1 methylene-tetrahydromethanopterin reductase [Mycobacterium persicum]ORB96951.1 methylene-tetrahydromethanopterin reductase [Mycobacterium persicum]ORC03627.1 methylene-tetrahydromethanopterin reductase [Mycobacterium persicum]